MKDGRIVGRTEQAENNEGSNVKSEDVGGQRWIK